MKAEKTDAKKNGKRIVACSPPTIVLFAEKARPQRLEFIHRIDPQTKRMLVYASLPAEGFRTCAFSPDGKLFAYACEDSVRIMRLDAGQGDRIGSELATCDLANWSMRAVTALALRNDGVVAVGYDTGRLEIFSDSSSIVEGRCAHVRDPAVKRILELNGGFAIETDILSSFRCHT
jgi:hypothetical protein